MAANTAATTAATAAQTGLNAAMAANPAGLLVTAIGTLLAVLPFAVAAALTESTDTLASSINEARQAYEGYTGRAAGEPGQHPSMVDALARLAEEERASAEKAAMLAGGTAQRGGALPLPGLRRTDRQPELRQPRPSAAWRGGVCPAGSRRPRWGG